ncbi:helix-turn-helix domain-containing protein [bacterium]|nr:helix-turn-helix domain-containing protein [bacterium]
MYEIIKLLLEEKGISFYKLSKDTGITESTFSQWKKGTNKPSTKILNLLANYFNVSIAFLLGYSNKRKEEKENLILTESEEKFINEIRENKEQKELITVFQDLTEENKKIFIDIGKTFKKHQKKVLL